jgi:predicted DNA-binding transcriptional regulator AlpA
MKLICAKEVAEMLGVSERWVSERVRPRTRPEDRIPHIKLGRAVRFIDAEIEDWILNQRTGNRRQERTCEHNKAR